MVGLAALVSSTLAGAATAPVGLGTAGSFGVLAGAGVTNTGPSTINGDLGTCPTPAITGFPPGTVNGAIHANDAVACQAQSDLTTAFNDAAGRAPTTSFPGATELGGMTLVSGVYNTPTSFAITGALTLDAQGDPNTAFIFQAGSTLLTAVNSSVLLINGAQACNVFWQVGSSATLGVGSTFIGTIMALSSITANTNATVQGRLLARNGAVTLDSNTVTRPLCAPAPAPTTTTAAPAPTTTTTAAGATTTTTAAGGTTTTTTAAGGTTTTTAAGATTTTTAAAAPDGATTTVPGAPGPVATTVPGTATTTVGDGTGTTPGTSPSGSGGGGTTGTTGALGEGAGAPGGGSGGGSGTGEQLARTGLSVQAWGFWGGLVLTLGCMFLMAAESLERPSGRHFARS